MNGLIKKIYDGERIGADEAVELYSLPLLEIGKCADAARKRIFGNEVVTFIIDRNISYTNICTSKCRFCAYYKEKDSKDAFLLSNKEILGKIEELVRIGGTQVMLQGGLNPELKIEYYVKLVGDIKGRFPEIYLHSFSPPEIDHIARVSGMSVREVLVELKSAGLASLPGGGGEILVQKVRDRVSPHKITADRWIEIMRTVHETGMKSTATMVFGMGETIRERIESMERVRKLQDETRGFRAFICWAFSPNRTGMDNIKMAGSVDYLKIVAVSRIFFDNIRNINSGWVTEGESISQIGLFFGANDLGGILMEEVVVKSTGLVNVMTVENLIRIIKQCGKIPAQRDTEYRIRRYF